MSILYKKSKIRKFQTGGVNPYFKKTVNPTNAAYIKSMYGDSYNDTDAGYAYKYGNTNAKGFMKGYNTAGAEGSYAGSGDEVMFSMTPGRLAQKGSLNVDGSYQYNMPNTAVGRDVTVNEYKANPSAFAQSMDGAQLGQYNKYLGIGGSKPARPAYTNMSTGGNYVNP